MLLGNWVAVLYGRVLWGPTQSSINRFFLLRIICQCVSMSTTRHSPSHHTDFLYLITCPVGGTSLEPFDLDRGHSRGLGKQTQDVVGYRRAVGSVVWVSVHTAQYCDSHPANSSGTGGTGGSDEIVAWLTAQTWTAPRQDVHTFLLFSASIFPPSLHDQLLVICPRQWRCLPVSACCHRPGEAPQSPHTSSASAPAPGGTRWGRQL